MAENDLVRLRPIDVAKVWGTALGQLIDLWRMALTAVAPPGSGEQPIPSDQSSQFSVPLVDGRMPRLTARDVVGETFHQRLGSRVVVFIEKSRGPGSVTMECSIDETLQPIQGDTYRGQVVNEDGKVAATFRLDAGS
ncbi:MAG: hypothetical protein JO037_13840 [Actinobacteria bacterium]|nr:hypothetical protein [Actinomycetota bacterium]